MALVTKARCPSVHPYAHCWSTFGVDVHWIEAYDWTVALKRVCGMSVSGTKCGSMCAYVYPCLCLLSFFADIYVL